MTGIYSILQFQKFIVCVGSQDKIAENPNSNSEMTWPNIKSYDEFTSPDTLIEQNELPRDKTNNVPSLIRVFAVRMKKAWILSYPLSAQRRLAMFFIFCFLTFFKAEIKPLNLQG